MLWSCPHGVGTIQFSFPLLWAVTKLCFHGFAYLPHESGSSYVQSTNFLKKKKLPAKSVTLRKNSQTPKTSLLIIFSPLTFAPRVQNTSQAQKVLPPPLQPRTAVRKDGQNKNNIKKGTNTSPRNLLLLPPSPKNITSPKSVATTTEEKFSNAKNIPPKMRHRRKNLKCQKHPAKIEAPKKNSQMPKTCRQK